MSCILHFLIITLLGKCVYTNKHICTRKSEIILFSIHQCDQFLNVSSEQKKSSGIITLTNKKQNPKCAVYHNKVNLNLNNSKVILDTVVSNSSVITSTQHDINNEKSMKNVSSEVSNIKENMCFSNKFCGVVPHIINRIHPQYPDHARILGIEGELTVMFDVNNLGKIDNIRILSAMPIGIFERNTRLAMRRWTYEKNKPIKNLTVVFKFCLNTIEIFDTQK